MAKKGGTIFQALDRAITGNWPSQDVAAPHVNTYDMSGKGDEVIYKTDNKEDYLNKKLELQQNKYLKDRWVKANVNLSVTAYAGLNNIKLMYRDADLMDAFPEIGAALTIVSEEATITNSDGMVVNIYSKSDRIKSILEDLFVNRLNIQLTAQMIIRAMCKYGNQFMLLDIDNKNGVKGWRQMPVFNVERIENGIQNPYGMGASIAVNGITKDNADMSTQFIWLDDNNSQIPFRDWQIAHFRLLENSLYLPYGCLASDTRIETEFGYKEIKDVQIGDKVWTFNTDTQERELAHVTMFMPKGKKNVYKVKTKHFEIEGTEDHKLLTSNSEGDLIYKEIKDLKIGDRLVCNNLAKKEIKKVQINKSEPTSFGKSKNWWYDYIQHIPEYVDEDFARLFGFLLGDGWLSHGYHVMFALGEHKMLNLRYSRYLEKFSGKKAKYEKYSDNRPKKLEYHTCFVGSKMLYTILQNMGFEGHFGDKRIPNWVYECENSIKEAFLDGIMDADGSISIISKDTLYYTIELCNEQLIKDIKTLVHSLGYKVGNVNKRDRTGYTSKLNDGKLIISRNTSYYIGFHKKPNKQEKTTDLKNRKTELFKLEKINKILSIGDKETYDFTVNNSNSNFFANGIVTHNCSYLNPARRHWRMLALQEDMMLIYRLERSVERRVYKIFVGAIDDADVQAYVEQIANQFKRTPIVDPMTGQIDLRKNLLGIDNDIFLPVRDENAPTPIDTLQAGQNLTAMDDIKFVQNKVLTALRIPKSFLNFEENAGDGKNLALMDVRFSRTINRIQQAFLMELTKVASIHLFLLGFNDELNNFTLSMNNPSTQAESLEIENMQKKIDAIRDAVSDPGNGLPVMSQIRALKTIMKWSDKEIKENLEEIRLEKGIAAELEKTSQIIKKTGIFDTVDRIYGEPGAEYADEQQGQGGMGDDNGMGGGGAPPPAPMGGEGDIGGDLGDLGAPGDDGMGGDIAGAEGSMPTADMGGNEGAPMESVSKNKPLLSEGLLDKYVKSINEHGGKNKETIYSRADVYDSEKLLVNEEFDKMIKALGKFVENE